jgi:hypothetical protein
MNTDKKTIQAAIEKRLVGRSEANFAKPTHKAAMRDEAAFLAGAATALHAVFGDPKSNELSDYVPPLFILYPMSGRSVVAYLKEKGVKAD